MANEPTQNDKSAYVDFSKFVLYTDVPNVSNTRARLAWGLNRYNPRITVFTNDPNDTVSHKAIGFGFSYESFLIFLDQLKEIAKGPNNEKRKIDYTIRSTDANAASTDRPVVATLYFGKDNDGIVWLSLHAPDRPKLKFNIQMSNWNEFYTSDGKQMSESLASVATAIAMVDGLKSAYGYMLGHYFVNPPPAPPRQTQNTSESKYKPNAPNLPQAFDDDISF